MYTYRAELIPLSPGPGNATEGILCRFGAEGWRLASTQIVLLPPTAAQRLSGQEGINQGLLVILERPGEPEGPPPGVPALAGVGEAA
jgi:hypothetical protein